ncbi:MAG: YcgL domain-containing protein [Proteobacteria bacterium]|nr:YcgL domain-containing protein [Pseudomonadota bacterium]
MPKPIIVDIIRSDTKTGLYIYLHKTKQVTELPAELLKLLGKYTIVMQVDLVTRNKLASEDIEIVRNNIKQQGYHLQLPKEFVTSVLSYT